MTDAEGAAAVPGPESCKAEHWLDFPVCERCGVAWNRRKEPRPPCRPMTIGRIREALDRVILEFEQSHDVLSALAEQGTPADPIVPLKRAAELRGVRRFLNRCLDNDRIMDLLNPKRRSSRGQQ